MFNLAATASLVGSDDETRTFAAGYTLYSALIGTPPALPTTN